MGWSRANGLADWIAQAEACPYFRTRTEPTVYVFVPTPVEPLPDFVGAVKVIRVMELEVSVWAHQSLVPATPLEVLALAIL